MLVEAVQYKHLETADATPRVSLRHDRRWNDLGYRTRFRAFYYPKQGHVIELGVVKILQSDSTTTRLEAAIEQLSSRYVSLGQGPEYYDNIASMGRDGMELLKRLRDITVLELDAAKLEDYGPGVLRSLFRFADARRVYRERTGRPAPTNLSFRYRQQFDGFEGEHVVDFHFHPDRPFGRINALVGSNASGKTAILSRLAFALSGTPRRGELEPPDVGFSTVLALSFSAFDSFARPHHSAQLYDYSGLRCHSDGESVDIATAFELLDRQTRRIEDLGRTAAWKQSLASCGVQLDPLLQQLSKTIQHMSSGQKFVTFVFTNLFAKLIPQTMVLFDEPELHTHPRMLSAIMRELSRLLARHDSYAMVATHSPLVLQELPASSVHVFCPDECTGNVRRYEGECFGAPLDEIVARAFSIGPTERNFTHYLDAIDSHATVDALDDVLAPDRSLSTQTLLRRLRKRFHEED